MDAVEDIKNRLSVEDVVADYAEIKRAGRNFKALSPFSNEKTPSLMVSPDKQIWHDFSSGKGGDMFSFVMEVENIDFKTALELLARKAGVDLDQYQSKQSSESSGKKKRLMELNALAVRFYQKQLIANQTALEYVVKKRGFNKQTLQDWHIGYSPNTGAALHDFLLKQGFNAVEMQQAGLVTTRYGRQQDMFRGRMMIPLCDPFGQPIGFTARLIKDVPNAPKYINTPQTILYDKGRHVFGLHLAKQAIRTSQYVVVAEGNLDVISSHQIGVKQVVATAGTAMTEHHYKILARQTHDVRLCFDQDNAGLSAMERVIPLASKQSINLSVITVPQGKDPDDVIKANPHDWQQLIEQKTYSVDWLINRYKQRYDITSAAGKRQFTDVAGTVITLLSDSVERDHYISQIAKLAGVNEEAFRDKLKGAKAAKKRLKVTTPTPVTAVDKDRVKTENNLLTLALHVPSLRSESKPLLPEYFTQQKASETLVYLNENPTFDGRITSDTSLQSIKDYVKMLSLLHEELYQNIDQDELRFEFARLRASLLRQYAKQAKEQIKTDLQDADNTQQRVLLEQAKKIDTLLHSIKE